MIQYTAENWSITEPAPNTKLYSHTNSGLKIKLSFTPQTNDVEFEIRDGDTFLGANYQYCPSLDEFANSFILNGGFNVFLQQQNVSMY